MDGDYARILQMYQLSPAARLSRGTEAEVYAYGPDAVVKLYAGTVSLANLQTLRGFYDSVERQRLPYALPRIRSIAQHGRFLVSIEQRLPGVPLSTLLPALSPAQLDAAMQRYLAAALALARIPMPPGCDRYKLFDPHRISARAQGDWRQFLARFLEQKLAEAGPYLRRDVPQFGRKVQRLGALLQQPYRGECSLIHGDFFPGNLLVDDAGQVSALLDFGLLTMYGDPLFDLATAWVFFDMYDELKAQLRERYLALLLERLGERARGTLYRYVLLYSILSANAYSATCADGHYTWCVANLNAQHYWDALE